MTIVPSLGLTERVEATARQFGLSAYFPITHATQIGLESADSVDLQPLNSERLDPARTLLILETDPAETATTLKINSDIAVTQTYTIGAGQTYVFGPFEAHDLYVNTVTDDGSGRVRDDNDEQQSRIGFTFNTTPAAATAMRAVYCADPTPRQIAVTYGD